MAIIAKNESNSKLLHSIVHFTFFARVSSFNHTLESQFRSMNEQKCCTSLRKYKVRDNRVIDRP